jgi:hypothetical protein
VTSDCFGCVLLEEVSGGGDQLQLCVWDQRLESMTCLRGYPSVLFAPEDQHGSGYSSVERLDLVGEALVGLGDLAIERVLSLGPSQGSTCGASASSLIYLWKAPRR